MWAEMETSRCPECPLDIRRHPCCPAALDLVPVVRAYANTSSVEQVEVRVLSEQREYRRRCDVQTALRSLIGLVMGSSACPAFAHLRVMARSHLPFADRMETARRLVAGWLITQHLTGEYDPDLSQLRAVYARLREVNVAFAGRLREASQRDASVNAIAALASLSSLVSFSLDDDLEEVRRFLLGVRR